MLGRACLARPAHSRVHRLRARGRARAASARGRGLRGLCGHGSRLRRLAAAARALRAAAPALGRGRPGALPLDRGPLPDRGRSPRGGAVGPGARPRPVARHVLDRPRAVRREPPYAARARDRACGGATGGRPLRGRQFLGARRPPHPHGGPARSRRGLEALGAARRGPRADHAAGRARARACELRRRRGGARRAVHPGRRCGREPGRRGGQHHRAHLPAVAGVVVLRGARRARDGLLRDRSPAIARRRTGSG